MKEELTAEIAMQQVSPEAPFQPRGSWAMGQASWSLWRNDYRSKRFVREWIRMMQNEKLLAAVPFADQTICELLVEEGHHLRHGTACVNGKISGDQVKPYN
jgi:hypothetical protein